MISSRIESLPLLYGSLNQNLRPAKAARTADSVLVQVPMVGEGNPAAAMAIARRLESNQIPAELSYLTLSGIPAQAWHRRMTQSSEQSEQYTQTSESTRKGRLAEIFGKVSKLEMEIVLSRFFDSNPSPILIGVQEMQFLSYTAPQLLSRFSKTFLYIPDVFPKESAVDILQRLPIQALVWNEEARRHLEMKGVNAVLVEPILPFAFADAASGKHRTSTDPYVLIKSSGSGMPNILAKALTEFHRERNIPFELWLPDRVITNDGSRPLPSSRQDKITTFYTNLLHNIPSLVIAYPSEMVQVFYALVLHNIFVPNISLNPRGAHELVNLNWAMKKGVITAQLDDMSKLPKIQDKILQGQFDRVQLDRPRAISLREVIARARS